MIDSRIEQYAEQLLAVLDRDIENLQDNITRLNELRCLVIRQDIEVLNRLLEHIRAESNAAQSNERSRQMLREKLAALAGCDPKEMTLTRIESQVSDDKRPAVAARKNKLRTLTELLKKEYAGTQTLLVDCARFNRLLLKNIFAVGQNENVTYKQTGGTERQTGTVFMDMQF
jgi:hypothetical protein